MSSVLEIMQQAGANMVLPAPHARALGFQMVDLAKGEATLKVPYRDDLVGDPQTGVIAGGVVTALLDHVCGQAVFTTMNVFEPIATLDLRIDYLRAAEPGLDIFAHAHCFKLTRSVAFVRATAYDRTRDDPVAAAQAAFMLNSSAGRPMGANLQPRRSDSKSEASE
jgi:uncharacterized protein (TIGR00369 family)